MYAGDTYFQNEYNNLNTAFEMNKEYLELIVKQTIHLHLQI